MTLTQNGSRLAATAVGLLSLTAAAHAQSTYRVTTDTSSLTGTLGALDLQLNGFSNALLASVAIDNVTVDGSVLAATDTLTGGATGILPAGATLVNSGTLNDLFQGITFGKSIAFDAAFTGPGMGPANPGSIQFGFALTDPTGNTPLLTSDPNGFLGEITINPDGAPPTVTTFQAATGGPPPTTITLARGVVPEPGSVALTGLCLPLMGGLLRRARRRAA